jgi:hypothetical protein
MESPATCDLDAAVDAARASAAIAGADAPHALFLLATGVGALPGRLARGRAVALRAVAGVPRAWSEAVLHHGDFHGVSAWIVEDAPLDPSGVEPAWHAAFPVWLAAAAGASTLVHVSAGCALERAGEAPLALGTLAFARDHLNLSGSSPLLGLGESRLGPLFPDLSRVHDRALRAGAMRVGARLGVACAEAVVACTAGPTIETPAERAWFARAGADVAVQRLAAPLIAAGHAGLGALAIAAVVAGPRSELDLARIAAAAGALAPAIEDLLFELAGDAIASARAELERGRS